jgi:hypothetical protein
VKQHRYVAESLLAKGADLNAKDGQDDTLFRRALGCDRMNMAELLCQDGGHE